MTTQALVIADEQGVIRLWNAVAAELFGHDSEAAIGESLDLIVPEEFHERHWNGYRHAWDEGIKEAHRVALMPVLCADGEVRNFAGHLLPVKGPHGALAAIAGIYGPPTDDDDHLFVMG